MKGPAASHPAPTATPFPSPRGGTWRSAAQSIAFAALFVTGLDLWLAGQQRLVLWAHVVIGLALLALLGPWLVRHIPKGLDHSQRSVFTLLSWALLACWLALLASGLIIPALPALRRRYPELSLEIATDVQAVNLHRLDADLDIRMVKPERGNVTLRRLGRIGIGLYGAPAYLAARPFTGLGGHDEIGWCETRAHLPAAQWAERALRGRPLALATTTLGAQLVAAKAGLGLAVLPHFLGSQHGLICVQPELGADQEIWLAVHADVARTPRVRAVADFLVALIQANRAVLEAPSGPENPADVGS